MPPRGNAPSDLESRIAGVEQWYHRIELAPGVVTPGINNSQRSLHKLKWPDDWSGLRVLDIGTRDGFFAFEAERRGADVTAVDYLPAASTGFALAAEVLGSKVTYVQENVYKIAPETLGKFDVVLFLGLLYHLPDPLGALDVVRRLCAREMYLETQAIDNAVVLRDGRQVPLRRLGRRLRDVPLMQFYPVGALNSDRTNFWAPNSRCLRDMIEMSGFRVSRLAVHGPRAVAHAVVADDAELAYYRDIARGERHPEVHDIAGAAPKPRSR
ncbi:MAG: class I SAM-dependent methyltransferase [Actinobacteria bacterium]|nr:class I SAM-dependent methyltransferase [Actinomycetota bacterium]